MSKTQIVITLVLPTTSYSRIGDFMADIVSVREKHKGADMFTTMSGPILDIDSERQTNATHSDDGPGRGTGGSGRDGRGGGVGRSEAAERAAADFAEPEGPESAAAEQPKRRGRPRKQPDAGGTGPEAEGAPARGRKRTEGAAGPAEGTARTEPVGTRQGAGEGAGQGQGGRGGAGGSRDDQRGDREASRVASANDGWDDEDQSEGAGGETAGLNDEEGPDWWCKTPDNRDGSIEWPDHLMPQTWIDGTDIELEHITPLLAAHFTASGGKDREPTFEIVKAITGERNIKNVDPDKYEELVRALLKDTARYEFGVKKPA